jgi:murein L,D-transpeptidase YafK
MPANDTEPKEMPTHLNLSREDHGSRTVEYVIRACEQKTIKKFTPIFNTAGISFPPKTLLIAVFKQDCELCVYSEKNEKSVWLYTYPVKALSGKRGPKQREGDLQVPEGVYAVDYMNPNSRFHLSFKLNYPNTRDRQRAADAGIHEPGTDIFIHGGEKSTGCVAIGDAAIEELFTLVALAGIENTKVVLFPCRPRSGKFMPCEIGAADTDELYKELLEEYAKLGEPVND